MSESGSPRGQRSSIWTSLLHWSLELPAWQSSLVALAIKHRRLTNAQIGQIYELFLQSAGLGSNGTSPLKAIPVEVPSVDTPGEIVKLVRIDNIKGVNALPADASLSFGSGLTIIYGRNGAGKSGFARLLANACFSRSEHEILPNIYEDNTPSEPSAHFHVAAGDTLLPPIHYPNSINISRLRHISVFDGSVAKQHISDPIAFEFKPSGFDVFAEMVRVQAALTQSLDGDIERRTQPNNFSVSFPGEPSIISEMVATLNGTSNLDELSAFSLYGDSEVARFKVVDEQLRLLLTDSSQAAIEARSATLAALTLVENKLRSLAASFSRDAQSRRNELAQLASQALSAVAAFRLDQFKRPFFKAIGSEAWEAFVRSAHHLAHEEDSDYPQADSRCLLCERPLDPSSQQHIRSLFEAIESDIQNDATEILATITQEEDALNSLDFGFFDWDTSARLQIHSSYPALEAELENALDQLKEITQATIEALKANRQYPWTALHTTLEQLISKCSGAAEEVLRDIELLRNDNQANSIEELRREKQILSHRQVLSGLYPQVASFVRSAQWVAKATSAKGYLGTRRITDKEKALFAQMVGGDYREKLINECVELDCEVPIELRTIGRSGETHRSLELRGGHKPKDVLSEGEQTVLALADFLTEVRLNPGTGGIILDDPVSSLDHDRKNAIAKKLVNESRTRQVIVFTHDMVFLNQLVTRADEEDLPFEKNWIQRRNGQPGLVVSGDAPSITKDYDKTTKAQWLLAAAHRASGSAQERIIREAMAVLRRVLEEVVVKRLLKGVVPRWEDRVIVTKLPTINWDNGLADTFVSTYENLSRYIEGHTHSEESMGAPPDLRELEEMIDVVGDLIDRAKRERSRA